MRHFTCLWLVKYLTISRAGSCDKCNIYSGNQPDYLTPAAHVRWVSFMLENSTDWPTSRITICGVGQILKELTSTWLAYLFKTQVGGVVISLCKCRRSTLHTLVSLPYLL